MAATAAVLAAFHDAGSDKARELNVEPRDTTQHIHCEDLTDRPLIHRLACQSHSQALVTERYTGAHDQARSKLTSGLGHLGPILGDGHFPHQT